MAAGDEALVGIDSRTGERRWYVDLRDDPDQFPCFSFAVADRMGRFYCGSENGEIEERDLRTGQLTGLRLDSQLGQVGDLTVGEGNELVEFSRGYFYRWRLDGSGPISTLVGPGRMTNAGYDPTGRYLELTPIGVHRPHDVLDVTTGARVLRVDRDTDARWLGARTLLLRDDKVLFVDPVTGRRWRPQGSQVEAAQELFPGADGGHAWAAIERDGGPGAGARFATFDVRELALPSGRVTGRTFSVPGYPYLVQPSADGRTAWVNFYAGGGSWLTWEDELGNRGAVVDVDGGTPSRDANILFGARNDRNGHDRVVGSDYVGEIREYDPDSMKPIATLPGAKGAVRGLRFSDDGRRLVSSSADGWVQVFDTAAWTRLGAIPALTQSSQEGWLRPDGRAVAVNGRLGVAVWNLDPATMAAAACTVAGRNLTPHRVGDVPR